MTESSTISLEEVRSRFLEAEARLGDAAAAIRSIEDAGNRVGAARESLTAAGEEIHGLAGRFGDVASSLTENAEELRRGVDAIRLGDPAAVRRQIEELDAAFTAMQSVTSDRFRDVQAAQTSLAEQLVRTQHAQRAAHMEARIGAVVTVLLAVAVLVLLVIR